MTLIEILEILLTGVGGVALIRAGILFLIRKNNADLDETIQYRRMRDQRMQELEQRVKDYEKQRDDSKDKEKSHDENIKTLTEKILSLEARQLDNERLIKELQRENATQSQDMAKIHLELKAAQLERDNAASKLLEKHEELEKERAAFSALQNQFNGFREALSFMNVLVEKKAELKEIVSNG